MGGFKMRKVYQRDDQDRRYYQLDEPLKVMSLYGPRWGELTMSIDMTNADSFRRKLQKESGVYVTITSLLVKATANAVEDFPIIGGMWLTVDKIWVADPGEIKIGYTAQIEDQVGLLFIERVSQKDLLTVSEELHAQVDEIRSKKKLSLELSQGPMMTITNVGTIGPVEMGALFRPEPYRVAGPVAGKIGFCAILEKPAVKDGKIQIRKLANAILFWDHTAMMANTPIEFLNELKKRLEEPDTYLV
jgi:pyruvate/2-oxoglutarate dehydrogenase complex dihydrolipoamide acyltransferase (E2) component